MHSKDTDFFFLRVIWRSHPDIPPSLQNKDAHLSPGIKIDLFYDLFSLARELRLSFFLCIIMAPRVLAAALRFHLEAECYLNTHAHIVPRRCARTMFSFSSRHPFLSKYIERRYYRHRVQGARLTSDGSAILLWSVPVIN